MRAAAQHVVIFAFVSGFALFGLASGASSDPENSTGQDPATAGNGKPHPGNPGEGDKPLLPGDQPAKQGTDPSSQVHNVDPKDLEGKKHKN